MIEDFITDTLEEYGPLYVFDLELGTREALGCSEEEVEDAIIRLEQQGRVEGFFEDTTDYPRIKLVCPCDSCRFKRDNYNPPNQCPNFDYFFDAFMSACGADIPTLKTDLCDKREAKE